MTSWKDLGGPLSRRPATIERREFNKICLMAAATLGLPASAALSFAESAAKGLKPSVVWLHFQECTGCTESLLRTSHPALAELLLDLISLDYHETLFAAAGHQAEAMLEKTMEELAGRYVCIVEGAIPTKDGGIYCRIGGHTAVDLLNRVAEKAGAVIAIGSCAAFGGIPAAEPNPTGAVGAQEILGDSKQVVSIPGCPANPYNLLGTVMHFVTKGSLPELDDKGRPRFAYGKTIHEACPRRAHFDAGRFAERFGDPGHEAGWCLYQLGCKGPETHANCATLHYGDVQGAWPIGVGHPCVGCSEQHLAFRVPIFEKIPAKGAPEEGGVFTKSAGAAAAGGLVAGAAIAGGAAAAMKKNNEADTPKSDEGAEKSAGGEQ